MVDTDKYTLMALDALARKDLREASDLFKLAEKDIARSPELRILAEITDLLLAVKAELTAAPEKAAH